MSWLILRWLLVLFGTSLLVFQDCQSLFLRHTQSGKCIAAESLAWTDTYGDRYWAEIVGNCLYDSAQFRYSDGELLKNIETGGTLLSAGGGRYNNRFVTYTGTSKAGTWPIDPDKSIKQTSGGSLFRHKANICALPSGNYIVEEKGPCKDLPIQKFTFGSVTDYDAKMKDVHCSSKQLMVIKRFDYGDFNKTNGVFNPKPSIDDKCSSLAACKVKHLCGGNRSCGLTVGTNLLSRYCTIGASKEFYTEYTCVDNYTSVITKVPNIRLSESPNEGFIEIKSGSTWRKVDEENWKVKYFREMLCQNLGFNDTEENDVIKKQLERGQEIASGAMIFYNKQSDGTDRCIHLQPSTTTSNVNISYAKCKICKKPLLQNVTMFPDSAFSGSGSSKYKDARFSNDGWCVSGPGTHYLLIDLQKEYHITQVVTLGDKNQTKWSGSYSLKYSHDKALVDQSSANQSNGNLNGYKASFTRVDIYNVRYLNIKSTDKTKNDFCLRIELCGEVQLPAPVENIITKPLNFSVQLSWTIPGPRNSSYITHFIIFLDGKEPKTILSREKFGNKFTLRKLKPYNEYTVRIQTQDGSSRKSETVATKFKTTEAVPNGPPSGVKFVFRSKDSLNISWVAPDETYWNGALTGYQICYSTSKSGQTPICSTTTALSTRISGLQPSTKYFVTVAAGTKAGYGNKSVKISKITNGEPVKKIQLFYSSLSFKITKPAKHIKGVMVVVQSATSNPTRSEDIKTNELKAYNSSTQDHAYVAAYLNATDLPLSFMVGDGNEYNYNDSRKFFNQPLKQKSSYAVFLRFFETPDLFYSTEWSSVVKTRIRPPAPNIFKPIATGKREYRISWSQPSLPEGQSVVKFHINYGTSENRNNQSLAEDSTSFTISKVAYDTRYTFEIEVQTQAGRSNVSSIPWVTHSAPLEKPTKTTDGYTVTLKKPKKEQNIETVALVLLRLESEKSQLPSPENIKVEESAPEDQTNVAFIARDFNITDFKESTIVISLQKRKDNGRRKRDVKLDILESDATYTTAQMNTDKSENNIWTYWSDPFTTEGDKVVTTDIPTKSSPSSTIDRGDPGRSGVDGEGSGGTGLAVGASVGAIVIVVAVVVAVIFFRRRRTLGRNSEKEIVANENFNEMRGLDNDGNDGQDGGKNRSVNECIYSNETGFVEEKAHPPVPVAEFSHYVNEMKAEDDKEFESEYTDLPTSMDSSWEAAKKPFNKKKNRYGNIVTYDYCRVVLSGDEEEDYINASFIDGIKTNAYIASQGPTIKTVDDMWRMVWEQRSYSIVMVTSLIEIGKPKCEKYWPDSGSEKYGDIEVTLMKTEEFAYHVTHTLQIKKDGEEREVRHYYYSSWPDHGVPKYPTQLLAFRRHFRTHHLEQSGPIIVHCSAGVGRTGVFLAIDMILQKLEKGLINSIDVFGQVCAMRERRMNMIQTLEQYVFVHEAILETILCGMNEVDSARVQVEIKNLAEVKASGMTGFEEKFKRLGEVSPTLSEEECTAGVLEGNYNKNRNKTVVPAECNRVPLQYIDGVEDSDYINAVFVHGYLGRNYFIATQTPLPNTINDFWRLVHFQKSSTIVLLNNVKDGTSFPKFWPATRGVPMQYGSLTVQLDSETEKDGIWTRKFILSPYPDLTDAQILHIFHYTKWADHRVPADANGIITLTSLVEKSHQSDGEGPVIVACSDGAGRSGTYIAISNQLERMKIEQAVDVFQSIKIIRGIRPQFVETAEQYQFCYTAMKAYLDAFSEYSNFE